TAATWRCRDRSEHAGRTTPAAGARGARADQGRPELAPAVSGRARRLPRHPPLPPLSAAGAGGRRCQADSAALRSPAHVRHVRAPCRNLNLDLSGYMGASLTMIDRHYGHPPATDASTRSSSSTHSTRPTSRRGRWWTLGGRQNRKTVSHPTTAVLS